MSKERSSPRTSPKRPYEIFGLTENEMLRWRVDQNRFEEILNDRGTVIHNIKDSSNTFGEFLFVTTSRPGERTRIAMTFYGLGYHQYRERWITDEWFWYRSNLTPNLRQQELSIEDANELLKNRLDEISPHVKPDTQTDRGRLFEAIADITDDDGALAEMQDMNEWADWKNDSNQNSGEIPGEKDKNPEPKPLFPLGGVMLTPGAINALIEANKTPYEFLHRHQAGDWGELEEDDIEENERSVKRGFRICSRYPLETGSIVWIITEWDRSVTTLLLPEEY